MIPMPFGLSSAEVDMMSVREAREASHSFVIRSLPQYDLCHWVSVPHMSHLTGSQSGCGCHGTCPVGANEIPPFQFPGRIHMLRIFWWETGNVCVCVCVVCVCDRCVNTCIYRMRYQKGEWAFEVTEEVGHVIVQPCVFVRARLRACMLLLKVCVGVHASLVKNSFLM